MKKNFSKPLALIVSALLALPVYAQVEGTDDFSAQAMAQAAMNAPAAETVAAVELPEEEEDKDENKWNWELLIIQRNIVKRLVKCHMNQCYKEYKHFLHLGITQKFTRMC